jgi:hypothetical protein
MLELLTRDSDGRSAFSIVLAEVVLARDIREIPLNKVFATFDSRIVHLYRIRPTMHPTVVWRNRIYSSARYPVTCNRER